MTAKVRVLVVDDEAAILRFLRPALEANGPSPPAIRDTRRARRCRRAFEDSKGRGEASVSCSGRRKRPVP